MSDLKLFRLRSSGVQELAGEAVALEKSLQHLIETNLEVLVGVRFLASEYTTGKKHGGRIDTLGIDENGCPVIIEYKRSMNQNVINQADIRTSIVHKAGAARNTGRSAELLPLSGLWPAKKHLVILFAEFRGIFGFVPW